MKHIKKKFSYARPVTEADEKILERVAVSVGKEGISGAKKIPKNYQAILVTTESIGITAFQYNHNGVNYFIPEPDPVLVYFNAAQTSIKRIISSKADLFLAYRDQTVLTEKLQQHLYLYFGLTSGFIIFLFTAIEAFLNREIPEEYEHRVVTKKKTEIYSKGQIEREFGFDVKMKDIIPVIHKKDFAKSYPLKQQSIQNLKEFRDSIVHIKALQGGHTAYDYIFKKSLDFEYEKSLLAVRDLFNFYKQDYVEECDCGADI